MVKKAPAKKAEEAEEIVPSKIKKDKEFDIEGGDAFSGDKVDDQEIAEDGADEGSELDEDAVLDEDEIDPFKDKWEE